LAAAQCPAGTWSFAGQLNHHLEALDLPGAPYSEANDVLPAQGPPHSLGKQRFTCDKCGVSTGRERDLRRHMTKHNENERIACPQCDQSFPRARQDKLRDHQRRKHKPQI
jgi:hypothetical protein